MDKQLTTDDFIAKISNTLTSLNMHIELLARMQSTNDLIDATWKKIKVLK